jgi:prevent-host-death family protein
MKFISRAEFKRNFPKYLRLAKKGTIVITLSGKPKWVLVGIKEYTSLVFASCGLKVVK